jgi:hypothetical protein
MMEEKPTNGTVTPSSEEELDDQHVGKLAVVGNSTPIATPKKANGVAKKKKEDMDEVEKSIYDEAVLACSIEV